MKRKIAIIATFLVLGGKELPAQAPSCEPYPWGMDFYFAYDGVWSDVENNIPATQIGSVGTTPDPWGQPAPKEGIHITPTSYLEFPDHPALNVGIGDFTIDAWFRWSTASSGAKVILDKRFIDPNGTQYRGYMLYVLNGALGLQTMEPPTKNRNIQTPYGLIATDNDWYHVAATVDRQNGEVKLYVNGQQAAPTSSNLPPPSVDLDNSAPAWIGRGHQYPNSEVGTFDVDEVELFHHVLNEHEIATLHQYPKCQPQAPTPEVLLEPTAAVNPLATEHTVTATVTVGGVPQSGIPVTFTVTSGPHAGTSTTAITDATGTAAMTYTGTTAGTDEIIAQAFGSAFPDTLDSNTATKVWMEEECCPDLSVTPADYTFLNKDYRVFTVSNPLKERICWLEINWIPNLPGKPDGGGPGPGVIIDSEPEWQVGSQQWFSFPDYNRIPPSGNIDLSVIPGNTSPLGAADDITFHLGLDWKNPWVGSVQIIAHYCDGSECELEFGPWDPQEPEVSDGTVQVVKASLGGISTLRLDASRGAPKARWISFRVDEGETLFVQSGEIRSRNREASGRALMAPHGNSPTSAMFQLPSSAISADFDVFTGSGRIATIRWTTFADTGAPLQTGSVILEGPSRLDAREAVRPQRPEN